MKLAEIRARFATLLAESKGIVEKYPDFAFPDDVKARADQITAELTELKGKLDEAKKNAAFASSMKQFGDMLDEMPSESIDFSSGGSKSNGGRDVIDDGTPEGKAASDAVREAARSGKREQLKAVSDILFGDAKYKKWLSDFAPDGNFSTGIKLQSPKINLPYGLKALVTGTADGSAGAFIFNDIQRQFDQYITRRPLVMRDIVTIGQTGSDTIEYVQQVSETNNAAMVPEAQSTAPIGDGTGGTVTAAVGGLKPESGMVFQRVTTNVKTVAHWIPATKRALSDAGQMQTLIDGFLRFGLEEELEDQMVLGDGAGENFTGLVNLAGVTAQAWDTNLLVTTRRAKTKVRLIGRATAQAYLLNPSDWEDLQLIRADVGGTEGPFLFGGPAATEVPSLWNLPVIECESVPVGVGYVGDFRKMILWDREQATVQMTDSHNDFFTRNLVAILAEARAAFGCIKPSAIVEMDLTAA
jgi:HK97 family phage major capsid protein